MRYLTPYTIFENNKETRTTPLTEEEFVRIINENCKQFNFK